MFEPTCTFKAFLRSTGYVLYMLLKLARECNADIYRRASAGTVLSAKDREQQRLQRHTAFSLATFAPWKRTALLTSRPASAWAVTRTLPDSYARKRCAEHCWRARR